MKVINSKQEFEKAYYYSPKYKPNKYPKRYPCLLDIREAGGGLMGEYMAHYVKYPARNQEKLSPIQRTLQEENNYWKFLC